MSQLFCEALKQTLDYQVIKNGDNDPLLLVEPLVVHQEYPKDLRAETPGEFIFEQSNRTINRRCSMLEPELDRLCLVIARNEFPCFAYFIHHGWYIFPTLRSIIEFFELLLKQEIVERVNQGLSFYEVQRSRSQFDHLREDRKVPQSVYTRGSLKPSL